MAESALGLATCGDHVPYMDDIFATNGVEPGYVLYTDPLDVEAPRAAAFSTGA